MSRVKDVSRERFTVFQERAKQFQTSMNDAFGRGDSDACVSHAVHCAISSLDALSVKLVGKKSSGQNHNEIVLLLKEVKTSQDNEKDRIIQAMMELIEMKRIAEYEDRAMSKREADKAIFLCKKVIEFAEKEIGNG